LILLIENENVLDGHAEEYGYLMGKEQGSVVLAVFEGDDSLPGDAKGISEFLLSDLACFAEFLDLVLQNNSSFRSM
jgi:hypothetical protein